MFLNAPKCSENETYQNYTFSERVRIEETKIVTLFFVKRHASDLYLEVTLIFFFNLIFVIGIQNA